MVNVMWQVTCLAIRASEPGQLVTIGVRIITVESESDEELPPPFSEVASVVEIGTKSYQGRNCDNIDMVKIEYVGNTYNLGI